MTYLVTKIGGETNCFYEAERCSGTFKVTMMIRNVTGTRGKETPTKQSSSHLCRIFG